MVSQFALGSVIASCIGSSLWHTAWLAPLARTAHGRRDVAITAVIFGLGPDDAHAFDNAVKKVKGPKQPGPTPPDLGLEERNFDSQAEKEVLGLKECKVASNCFSTTYSPMVDSGSRGIAPWRFQGKTPSAAMKEVLSVVNAYPPGQQGIDGGGFEVKVTDLYYLYVQFESLKKGYIDDVEFAIAPGTGKTAQEGLLLVRSASRRGFQDYGVNALRLNHIAQELQKRGGWIAPQITAASHPAYWQAICRTESVQEAFPEYCPLKE